MASQSSPPRQGISRIDVSSPFASHDDEDNTYVNPY